jgi:arylsulfatase A-like enzyme
MKPLYAFVMLAIIGSAVIAQAADDQQPTASSATTGRQPNVLLIVSDDHQAGAMGCAGNPVVKTPNLDRLAGAGVRFSNAFVTIPICTPSRAAFLTGRFGASNGITFFSMRILPGTPTWPSTLAQRGYQTAITGKWHIANDFGDLGFQWSANVLPGGMGPYENPKLIQHAGETEADAKVVKGNITEIITDSALRFLNERDKNKPFFLYVAYTAPHDPRTPPPEYERMYPPDKMPLPPNFKTMPSPDPGTLNIRDEKLLPLPRDPDAVRREVGRYYGLITHMDHQIGRILDTLDKLKLTDDTIVFFAGDNGLALGAHGLLGKQTLHDEGVHVPLIVRNPKLDDGGRTCDAPVYLIDMFPTACTWTGTPIPAGVQGMSLADVYAGKSPNVRDTIFGRYDEGAVQYFRSIRTSRYKLIQYNKLGFEQLFDLTSDPRELTDLIDDPAQQAARQQLNQRLGTWRAEQDRMEATWRKSATQPDKKIKPNKRIKSNKKGVHQ